MNLFSSAAAAVLVSLTIHSTFSLQKPAASDWIHQLGAGDPAVRLKAYQSLKDAGAGEIVKCFDEFRSAAPIAKELLAKLLRESGDLGGVAAIEPFIKDTNPLVRLEFTQFLARPDFALGKSPERAAQLLILARDPEFNVRDAALKGLGRLAEPAAIDGLVKLTMEGDDGQCDYALRALGATPGSAESLLSLESWIRSHVDADDRSLWLLALGLTGDARVVPTFLQYAKHPADGAAAASGFDLLIQRLIFRRRDAELLQSLEAWKAVDPVDVAWRRLKYELFVQSDLGEARRAARELDAAAALENAQKLEWRAAARACDAMCDIADGKGAEAEAKLQIAFDMIQGRRGAGADDDEDEILIMFSARMRTLSAFNAILNKFPGAPDPAARTREAYNLFHERVFKALVRSLQGLWRNTNKKPNGGMGLLNLIANGKPWGLSANWNFDPALETETGTLTIIASVLPKRGRGAEGLAAGVELLNLLSDINPREFVTSRHSEDWQNARSGFEFIEMGRLGSVPISPIRVALDMSVSSFARDLGQVARSILGDMKTAAELLEPIIERAAQGAQMGDLSTFVDASLERAGVAMDAQEPEVADQYILRILERLDQVKKTHEEEFDAESVKLLGSAVADARSAQSKLWLELERRLRAQTLISRAVNENVVKQNPQVAARYAKEGVALEPTEFNKVVLACYLAREGNTTEARAVLRDASDSPGTYYNLACTYALLGEAETAIRYLERDFQEHADKGGLERQRKWARKDPDLKSLRSNPRFVTLVSEDQPNSRPAGTQR